MRPSILALGIGAALSISVTVTAAEPIQYTLKPVEGGGFIIEQREPQAKQKAAIGLAAVADLAGLLTDASAPSTKVDFTAGKKLEGVYTVLIGRDDGTLGKFENASDVVIFAAPSSMTTTGDLTTLSGAVVFALKIDNAGGPAAVQRFESGAITLTRTRKSL